MTDTCSITPRPCFLAVHYGIRCRRPKGHEGKCATRPLPGEVTSPTSSEITKRCRAARAQKLRRYGVKRLEDIPGSPAFFRAKRRAERLARNPSPCGALTSG